MRDNKQVVFLLGLGFAIVFLLVGFVFLRDRQTIVNQAQVPTIAETCTEPDFLAADFCPEGSTEINRELDLVCCSLINDPLPTDPVVPTLEPICPTQCEPVVAGPGCGQTCNFDIVGIPTNQCLQAELASTVQVISHTSGGTVNFDDKSHTEDIVGNPSLQTINAGDIAQYTYHDGDTYNIKLICEDIGGSEIGSCIKTVPVMCPEILPSEVPSGSPVPSTVPSITPSLTPVSTETPTPTLTPTLTPTPQPSDAPPTATDIPEASPTESLACVLPPSLDVHITIENCEGCGQ